MIESSDDEHRAACGPPAAQRSAPASRADRLVALDWLRGLVMFLMAVDHCDGLFNTGHTARDGVWLPQVELQTGDFLTRWATHLCAPTFVFLAGVGMAMSVARAHARFVRARAIDGYWLLRSVVLVAIVEVGVMAFFFRRIEPTAFSKLR